MKKIKRGSKVPEHLPHIGSGKYLIEELPFNDLYTVYNTHKRLIVFAEKGLKCAHPDCQLVGTRLLKNMDNGGGIHVDLFTDCNKLMTVDHIHPKSKGGGEELENKQPMCERHNSKKGSKIIIYSGV